MLTGLSPELVIAAEADVPREAHANSPYPIA
jgi:hypothetical protein